MEGPSLEKIKRFNSYQKLTMIYYDAGQKRKQARTINYDESLIETL